MNKIGIRQIVRFLAIGGFNLYLFPLLLIVCLLRGANLDSYSGVLPLSYALLAYCIFSGYLGACTGWISEKIRQKLPEKSEKKDRIKTLILSNAVLIPAFALLLAGLILFLPENHWLLLLLFATGILYSLISGQKLHFKKYYEFFSGKRMGFAVGFNVAAELLLLWIFRAETAAAGVYTVHLFWVFFAYIIIYCVTRNQSNIDKMMERRHHKLEHLPNKMRYYSLWLTVILFAVILLVFLFRGFFAEIFGRFFSAIGAGLLYVIRKLLLRMLGEETNEQQMGFQEQDPSMGLKDAFADDNTNPLWDYLFYPLVFLAIITLLIVYRKSIAEAFARLWAKAVTLARKIFLNSQIVQRVQVGESEYYFDAVETLDPDSIAISNEKNTFRLKDWKKLYRKFKAMAPGKEKFRYGYALSLEWLRMHQVPLENSDTCVEIYHKSTAVFPEEQFGIISECYDHIRYGDEPVQLSAVETLCDVLDSLVK